MEMPPSADGYRPATDADERPLGERFSFEFFPPKDAAAEAVLWSTIRRLEPLSPAFVSVTYGAGGSTRDRTTRLTEAIAANTTLTPAAHLTCVGASRAELRQIVGAYADAGVSTIMALRGDPPAGPGAAWVPHPDGLDHAEDLVRLIRELGAFRVGVAAFPDGHPASPDLDTDVDVLASKAAAGADFAVTQFFFEPSAYFRLLGALQERGVEIPVIPGIMPITQLAQVKRFAELSGAPLPQRIASRIDRFSGDPEAVRRVGVEIATELCEQLLDGGAPGLHFYTLNRSAATMQVCAALGVLPPGRDDVETV